MVHQGDSNSRSAAEIDDITEGDGPTAAPGMLVTVDYVGVSGVDVSLRIADGANGSATGTEVATERMGDDQTVFAGIALILVGALLLHAGELRHGASGPVRAILRERASRGLHEILARHDNEIVVLVSHNAVNKILICAMLVYLLAAFSIPRARTA